MSEGEWIKVTYKKPKKIVTPKSVETQTKPIEPKIPQNKIVARKESNGLHKIENETENFAVKRFGSAGKEIIALRTIKRLTQRELAQKCNVQLKEIQDLENGTGVYNGPLLNKVKSVLNK